MRLLFIRHADPDYEHDCLNETGKKEADALADFLSLMKIDAIYVSPLGRAQETMKAYLKKRQNGIQPIVKEWLCEFNATTKHDTCNIAWDFLPETLEKAGDDAYSLKDYCTSVEAYKNSDFKEKYDVVIHGLDEILLSYGYQREKHHYRVNHANTLTIAFFCHFGVESMMLSHLINASPINIAQYFCAAPSSVTTLYTEERRKEIAQWRITAFGDTSHLTEKGMEPSFSARFSETYDDPRRHD